MTLQEAITQRHSVRKYIHKTLGKDIIKTLQEKIEECNQKSGLHIQLVTNETKAFTGLMAYGKFHGVENYLVMVGKKGNDLDERVGYFGEKLVLIAQTLGLNTCWVGMSYRKVSDAYQVDRDEKLVCMIALGYGETQGVSHKIKTIEQVSNATNTSPEWFLRGVKAALLAPTAINQQKFTFILQPQRENEKPKILAKKGFSIVGYTSLDLGIAKCNFEIGAGKENFDWE